MDGMAAERDTSATLDALSARVAGAADARLAEAVLAAARHLHALVRETRPSSNDLRRALEFLTDVGQHSDARRQEWVLLADVLGVSTLVEDLGTVRPPGATPNTLPGPFYRADVPEVPNGGDISRDKRGERMRVSGRVTALDGRAAGGAVVEVWQANGDGVYENQEPDQQPEFNLRGRLRAEADGSFGFLTVRPRGYCLPSDGPVGMLMAALGYRLERPAHLHFRISAPGYDTLTTHVFDRGDPAIGRDALFGVKEGLLGDIRRMPPGSDADWGLDVAFVLAPAGAGGG